LLKYSVLEKFESKGAVTEESLTFALDGGRTITVSTAWHSQLTNSLQNAAPPNAPHSPLPPQQTLPHQKAAIDEYGHALAVERGAGAGAYGVDV